MTNAIKIISFALAAAVLLLFIIAFSVGTEGVSAFLGFDITNISIPRAAKTYEFSLPDRLPILLLVGAIGVSFFCVAGIKAAKTKVFLTKSFSFLKSYTLDTFRIIMQSKVKYILLISFFTSVYLAYFFPLTLDEPQTYYDFIKPSVWEALSLYPYPNNHVLSSLLSSITNELSFVDLLFRLRIPVLIVSLLTWVFAYRFVKKFFSENLALFVVAVGSVVVTNLQHAYIARGYAYVMLFVVIGLYAAYNIIYCGNRRRDWLTFAISTALGAWAMPSYLYPFLSISIFVFIYNYRHLKTQILYSALVGVLVFLLYSPILIISGLDALTSNQFVETIDRWVVLRSIPGFMLGTVVHIFYAPYYVLIAIWGLTLLYALGKRDKNTLILWAVFCLTPCLFLVLHSVLPFFRTFFYYGFIFIFLIGVTFKDPIGKIKPKAFFISLLVVHILLLTHFFVVSRELMKDVFLSADLREKILENNKSYYLQDDISWIEIMNMKFEAERRGYQVKVSGGNKTSVEQLEEYDYCLISKSKDRTTGHKPILETKSVFSTPINVYKKEKEPI